MNSTKFIGICIYEKFPNQISQKLLLGMERTKNHKNWLLIG